MKILHLSFHYGCISDIQSVFTKLGHDVTYKCMLNIVPYTIDSNTAVNQWNENKNWYNSFDIIITSDTVALSYIFLKHLKDLKPHLIILNCNRFDYAMERIPEFVELLRTVNKQIDKITYIPYTDFERIWCGKHEVYLHERAISPIGNFITHIKDDADTINRFKSITPLYKFGDNKDTVFLQRYHNHHMYMNLPEYLCQNKISSVIGSYLNISDLKEYKCMIMLPDQFSKYFTFESIQNEIVVLLPSHKFLMELVNKVGYYFNIEGSSGRLTNEFVNLCEWYKYPESRIYFNSFDEMISIIKNLTDEQVNEKKKWCRFYSKVIEEEHTMQWKHVLAKIEMKIAN